MKRSSKIAAVLALAALTVPAGAQAQQRLPNLTADEAAALGIEQGRADDRAFGQRVPGHARRFACPALRGAAERRMAASPQRDVQGGRGKG